MNKASTQLVASVFRVGFLVTLLIVATDRTLPADEPTTEIRKPNLLAKESSPYLLQHAYNPVWWHPWGDAAIEKAKRENKLIFLSVGYSACHWCHVMEDESFTDTEIAEFMNKHFVCVKVDREERPDVDQIYMSAVQMMSGSGGWPMSVFLLPDTKPFWGGTYFPARTGDRGAATGFLTILQQLDEAWRTRPDAVRQQAEKVTGVLRQQASSVTAEPKTEIESKEYRRLVDGVADALTDQFDPDYGGFGYSARSDAVPKFPEPSNLLFLLQRSTDQRIIEQQRAAAKRMLLKTLDGMISGAMYDHLGGGFHRYSVDRRWQIPHFEKMLYDNGQLASVYAEAYALTGQTEYRSVAEGICDFVLREMKAPGGAFYSAIDADSEHEEGKFYRWTKTEFEAASKTTKGHEEFARIYGFQRQPNFEGHYFAPDPRSTLTTIAKQNETQYENLIATLLPVREQLFSVRAMRVRPGTDTKILAAWNGLMIAGLADAGRILRRPDYVDAAAVAAEFVVQEMRQKDGRLFRTYAGGESKLNAYLDDYAFMASGLIALHRTYGSGDGSVERSESSLWLDAAMELTDAQMKWFWDEQSGGFFFTSSDHPALIVRSKDPVDGALPAGNSVAAENLEWLTRVGGKMNYRDSLQEVLASSVTILQAAPASVPRLAAALSRTIANPVE